MEFSEKSFQILDALDRQEIFSQRQLAEHSGVSRSQVNYLLKRLFKKGLVKIKNFQNSPNKRAYLYLLTPKGAEAKSRLAVKFVRAKLEEYEGLRTVLAERLAAIEKKGHFRFIFVGPGNVKELMDSVVKERSLKLILAGHCKNLNDLKEINPESFDVALIFDDQPEGVNEIGESLRLPGNKILPLW
ncbi:MAG TPA: MarR family EPS-associated transcriptional regulator [Deltaproteobacteria bacterium]|nr:MarR family EPS-associated transcriptional regulator [Deltaproteobacteria bacterium]MBW2049998.1 MarR family EPS-associated transcriptional regulator [Deltaproteobacteria bacterium]MBW2112349.1 MarR family EPS-associated transcriptional regulator [Deltaproteobacteria bacterium]MBW2354549.1 MarR family EPS-associated transcriptional regulator [Deltaproteobacteria bacterium]HDH97821.1 MarR family EPS-associated transcriptional regulator [Deltaproteobacteria bacterium]